MPSRKKAQGQARKAKQAAEAALTAHGGVNSTNANLFQWKCDHLGEHRHDFSRDGWSALDAYNLFSDGYISKVENAIDATGYNVELDEVLKLSNDFYDNNYRQFGDVRKDFFRRMIISWGTQVCLKNSSINSDYSRGGNHFMFMLTIIEARDRYNGTWNSNIYGEVVRSINDIHVCPRAMIRFFHRRNSCDCLQDIYYHLKETTKRTTCCWNCVNLVDIKLSKECTFCKTANYCSFECAVADWPRHDRAECRELTMHGKQKEKIESFNDIEAVD